jgi:hypothetical protein
MRNLIYSMMVSLDGYIETTDRNPDWPAPAEELHILPTNRRARWTHPSMGAGSTR